MSRRLSRCLALPFACAALAACGDATGVVVRRPIQDPNPVQYPLRTVDGYSVPYMVALTETGQIEIVAGFIALTEAGRQFEMRTLWREIYLGEIREQLVVVTGRYTRFADGIEVVTPDGAVLWLQSFGDALQYRDRLFRYTYWR